MITKRTKSKKPGRKPGRREEPYKDGDFRSYIMWKSLPTLLRNESDEILKKLGLEDPIVIKLIRIKSQAEFCKEFNIGTPGTLTAWNKRIEDEPVLVDERKKWMKKLTGNVMMAVYRSVLKDGDRSRAELWIQYCEDFKKAGDYSSPEIEELTILMRKIADRKVSKK